jgi:hypothetical protein
VKGDLEALVGGGRAGFAEGLTVLADGRFCAERATGMAVSRRARASRLMRRIVRVSGRG